MYNFLHYRIFEIAPEAIQLFPKFRDVPAIERESDENFRGHALQVMEAVSLAVSSLDDIPSLCLVLKDLGSLHCAYGVQDAHFEVSEVSTLVPKSFISSSIVLP